MESKVCRQCRIEKPLSDYDKRSKKPGDYKATCKACNRDKKAAIQRKLRTTDEAYAERQREWTRAYRKRATPEQIERVRARDRKRGPIRHQDEAYREQHRNFRRKYYHIDIEKSRDRMIYDFYKRRGLPDEIIEGHLAIARVKRAINGTIGKVNTNKQHTGRHPKRQRDAPKRNATDHPQADEGHP